MSKVTPPILAPLEMDGIQYEEIRTEGNDQSRRSGFMRARRIATGTVLWELQVYEVIWDENPLTHLTQDIFFIRFKFMPDKKNILIENEYRQRFLVSIATKAVREALDTDFPPELLYQRKPPQEVLPLVYRNLFYKPNLDGIYEGKSDNCGVLEAYAVATGKIKWAETIYSVPFNHDIENDQQECYFESMEFMYGHRDILIRNQAGDEYLFEIRTHKVRKYDGDVLAYYAEKRSILKRVKYFFSRYLG